MTVDKKAIKPGDEVTVRMAVLDIEDRRGRVELRLAPVGRAQEAWAWSSWWQITSHTPALDPKPRDWRWGNKTPDDFWPLGEPPKGLEPGDDVEVMFHGGSTARGNLTHTVRWDAVVAYRVHASPTQDDVGSSNPRG